MQNTFPHFSTLTTEAEVCATCEALIHISREDRREAKLAAEEEKVYCNCVSMHPADEDLSQAKLKHMCDNALSGGTALLENVPCALVPTHFVRSWKQWLFHPAETPRPDGVDTAQFICPHDMLILDPNSPGDLENTATIVMRKDWDTLQSLYVNPFCLTQYG